jgi:hypothetical protein
MLFGFYSTEDILYIKVESNSFLFLIFITKIFFIIIYRFMEILRYIFVKNFKANYLSTAIEFLSISPSFFSFVAM